MTKHRTISFLSKMSLFGVWMVVFWTMPVHGQELPESRDISVDPWGVKLADENYEIVFVARQSPKGSNIGLPGHSFVVFNRFQLDAKQSRTDDIQAWGFWPPEYQENWSKIEWQGAVVDDLESEAMPELHIFRLRVRVTKQQYDRGMEVVKGWDEDKQKKYNFFVENCVHFSNEVAKAIGMETPDSVDFTHPGTYLNKLINLNLKD